MDQGRLLVMQSERKNAASAEDLQGEKTLSQVSVVGKGKNGERRRRRRW